MQHDDAAQPKAAKVAESLCFISHFEASTSHLVQQLPFSCCSQSHSRQGNQPAKQVICCYLEKLVKLLLSTVPELVPMDFIVVLLLQELTAQVKLPRKKQSPKPPREAFPN